MSFPPPPQLCPHGLDLPRGNGIVVLQYLRSGLKPEHFFLPHLAHPISISFLTFRSCRYSSSGKSRGVLLTDTLGQSAISLLFKESKSFPLSVALRFAMFVAGFLAHAVVFQGCVIYYCDFEHVITAIA